MKGRDRKSLRERWNTLIGKEKPDLDSSQIEELESSQPEAEIIDITLYRLDTTGEEPALDPRRLEKNNKKMMARDKLLRAKAKTSLPPEIDHTSNHEQDMGF